MNTKFCITLTTIPSRLSSIQKTINSIEKQTLIPKKIFLNIPYEYYRFPGVKINNNQLNLETLKLQLNSGNNEIIQEDNITNSIKWTPNIIGKYFYYSINNPTNLNGYINVSDPTIKFEYI